MKVIRMRERVGKDIYNDIIVKFPTNKFIAVVPLYGTGQAYHVSKSYKLLKPYINRLCKNNHAFMVITKDSIIDMDCSGIHSNYITVEKLVSDYKDIEYRLSEMGYCTSHDVVMQLFRNIPLLSDIDTMDNIFADYGYRFDY